MVFEMECMGLNLSYCVVVATLPGQADGVLLGRAEWELWEEHHWSRHNKTAHRSDRSRRQDNNEELLDSCLVFWLLRTARPNWRGHGRVGTVQTTAGQRVCAVQTTTPFVVGLLTKDTHVLARCLLGKPCGGPSFSSLASRPTTVAALPLPTPDMRWCICAPSLHFRLPK